MLGMVGLSASDQTRQHLGIGMDENPFHEMSTFSMSEDLSVLKLPPRCDVFACFKELFSRVFATLSIFAFHHHLCSVRPFQLGQ